MSFIGQNVNFEVHCWDFQGWFLYGPGCYIPNFSPIRAMVTYSQWRWSFGPFYIVKQWFLGIFGCQSNIVLWGVRSSRESQNVTSPVYFTFQKIFPYKIFQNVLRYWIIGHFLKYQNWHVIICYLITEGSKWPGNTTNECRSYGIFLNDTPPQCTQD